MHVCRKVIISSVILYQSSQHSGTVAAVDPVHCSDPFSHALPWRWSPVSQASTFTAFAC